MKIQLDSVQKIIRIEENVNLGELVKYLDKLLPKNSTIGYWKDFTLETNTVINNWTTPYIWDWNKPLIYPTYGKEFEITCNANTITPGIFNLDLN